jgi:NADH:ubiquinone oxidoreductase subunit K
MEINIMTVPLSWYLITAFALFGLGIYGIATKRNLIRVLISSEIAANGASIAIIAFSTYSPSFNITGQIFVLLLIALAAAQTAIVLCMVLLFHRRYQTTDLLERRTLRG